MENLNLHKSKLYALAAAALAFIAMLLPWQTYSSAATFFQGFGGMAKGHINGFNGWGWLSLIGVLGVIVASLMGDKTKFYDETSKMIVMGGFGLIILGAVIFLIRAISAGNAAFKSGPGFGLFICLIAGGIGLLLVMGIVKVPDSKPPAPPGPPPPTA